MSYVVQGFNPYTKEPLALFNWQKLRERAVTRSPFGAVRASAKQVRESQDGWMRLEFDGGKVGCRAGQLTLCYDVENPPQGVDPGDESRFRLGLGRDEQTTCILRAGGGPHQLGGMARWHQVDDSTLSYFVSGAYMRHAPTVRVLERAGLAPESLRSAVIDGAALGAALDAGAVDPGELSAGFVNWHQVCQLDSDRENGMHLASGRLHVFALFEDDELVLDPSGHALAWPTLQYT